MVSVMPPVGVPPPPHVLSSMHHTSGQEEHRSLVLSSPVRTPLPEPGVEKELNLVVSGLSEFKTELLQLHTLV